MKNFETPLPGYMIRNAEYFERAKKRGWLEASPVAVAHWETLVTDIEKCGGDALVIDYGYDASQTPDTFTLRVRYLVIGLSPTSAA